MAAVTLAADDEATTAPESSHSKHGAATAMTAAARVLSTYELLESILSHTSTICVAHCRRVNHYWSQVINQSKNLQQRLFFLPARGRWVLTTGPDEVQVVDNATVTYKRSDIVRIPAFLRPSAVRTLNVVQLHPLLTSEPIPGADKNLWNTVMSKFSPSKLLSLPDGPWQQMLISQPAVNRASLYFGYDGNFRHEAKLTDESGIKLYHIIQAVESMLRALNRFTSTGHFDNDDCKYARTRDEAVARAQGVGDERLKGHREAMAQSLQSYEPYWDGMEDALEASRGTGPRCFVSCCIAHASPWLDKAEEAMAKRRDAAAEATSVNIGSD